MSDVLGVPPRTLPLVALPTIVGPLSIPSLSPISIIALSGVLTTLLVPPSPLPLSILNRL